MRTHFTIQEILAYFTLHSGHVAKGEYILSFRNFSNTVGIKLEKAQECHFNPIGS
jgi:hypothetical protein